MSNSGASDDDIRAVTTALQDIQGDVNTVADAINTIEAARAGLEKIANAPAQANVKASVDARANAMALACVPITMRWRRRRSAAVPPSGASRKTGIWLANPTVPRSKAEPVSRYTSHDCATVCIQVPISEISWPVKKS